MAWERGGADSQSLFDKSTAQAQKMKQGLGVLSAARMDRKKIPLRTGARLVNHRRKHVRQLGKLFCYLPPVSLGILAGEVFAYPPVIILVIDPMPGAFHVDEHDPVVVRTNADLLDSEPRATVKDCLT